MSSNTAPPSGATGILKTDLCPALPADFVGVRIASAPRPLRASPLVVHGSYRVAWAEADRIAASRHRAIVLVVSQGLRHWVGSPFRERILFEDDEQQTRAGALGHFTLDVFDLQGSDAPGEYHLLVSLGPYTSNVLLVAVL